MPAEESQGLSSQDLQDLQQIKLLLPMGDPRHEKLNTLLSQQLQAGAAPGSPPMFRKGQAPPDVPRTGFEKLEGWDAGKASGPRQSTYLEDFGNWAKQTAQSRQQEELKASASGQGDPTRAAIRSFAPNTLASMSDMLRGILSPGNVAAGATMAAFPLSAAAIMPYFAAQGGKDIYQASTSKEGLGNPDRAQQALMGGATMAGSLAGLKVSGPAISEMLPSVKRGSAAFQHLDSALADMTSVTEPKFNIDRVANSARKVSDRFSATDLKSAPPLVQKLLERATDTAQPMTWPELRTFKTDLNTLIWDREIPSQFKGPLKNLATDVDTTLRQGAGARGQGEVFSKANTDFRRSFKMQDVAEKAGPYVGAGVGAGLGAMAGEAVGHPWPGYWAGKVAGYKAGGPLAGSLVRSITERNVPPQEFPEISPSQVRTTQPTISKGENLNLARLTKDMQSLGYDKATALQRAKAALQQHPNDLKAATDAAIRGKT